MIFFLSGLVKALLIGISRELHRLLLPVAYSFPNLQGFESCWNDNSINKRNTENSSLRRVWGKPFTLFHNLKTTPNVLNLIIKLIKEIDRKKFSNSKFFKISFFYLETLRCTLVSRKCKLYLQKLKKKNL